MVNESRLMLLAIKYRERILSRLCDLEIVEEMDWGYNVLKNKTQDNPLAYVDHTILKECKVHKSNQDKHTLKRCKNLFRILLKPNRKMGQNYFDMYKEMAMNGVEVVLGTDSSIFCNLRDVHRLLKKFHSALLWMDLPEGCRLSKSLRPYYLTVIENQISEIKQNKHPNLLSFHYHYYKSDITLRGIFAYAPIYKEIEWDFEFINANIHSVDWVKLIADSNIKWTEEALLNYERFIPYVNSSDESIKSYCEKFNDACIKCYEKLGFLSSSFINSHKHLLEWNSFFSRGIFQFSPYELKSYYNYAKSIETEYYAGSKCTAGSQISIRSLFENENFKWTHSLLLMALSLDSTTVLNICVENDKFNKLLRDIPDYKHIVEATIDNIKKEYYEMMIKQQSGQCYYPFFNYDESIEHWNDFWLKFNNGGAVRNNAYQEYFTPENIKNNIASWNRIIEEKFTGMKRRPDTNYHYYRAYNMWDRFNGNKYIKLTYDLCKILYSIEIEIGGTYVLEDGTYLSEDFRNETHNALELFSGHNIMEEDIEQIINDPEILDFIMKSNLNNSIVDYIIKNTIIDSSVQEYINIINDILSQDSEE